MKLEVVTPEENMGDVIGDLNKRRGQVEGMESSRSGARIVKAMVPLLSLIHIFKELILLRLRIRLNIRIFWKYN